MSAADVNSGEFPGFHSHPNRNAPPDVITHEVILASAAVPTLFRAEPVDGHRYWDGLFALNPPVRDLPDAGRGHCDVDKPPDEIWAILINPIRYRGEPTRMDTIRDPRNELAANISFQQEITFIGKINELVLEGQLVEDPKKKGTPLSESVSSPWPTKSPTRSTTNPSSAATPRRSTTSSSTDSTKRPSSCAT